MTEPTTDQPSNGIRIELPVRWGDMDAYGHINNVQIVRLMEETRILAFGTPSGTGAADRTETEPAAPIELISAVPDNVMTLISEHRVKYVRQLPYRRGRTIPVEILINAVKGASIEVGYNFYDPVTGAKAVVAETTMVFVDHDTGRPVRLNDAQKAALAPYTAGRK